MKTHNITSITIEPNEPFKMVTVLKTGKVITLTGQHAIDVFLETIPLILGENVH